MENNILKNVNNYGKMTVGEDKKKGVFVLLKAFEIAEKKAEEINKMLSEKDQKMVSLYSLLQAVEKISGYEISARAMDFSEINTDNPMTKNAGAMLSTVIRGDDKRAIIVYNSGQSISKQRFSVAHELGHLVTDSPTIKYETPNDEKFTVSTLINPDIMYISDEDCKKSEYNMAEQIANIFALKVLIPDNITVKNIMDKGAERLAKEYGVEEEALYSRLLLSVEKE